jgi:hypothetical protein
MMRKGMYLMLPRRASVVCAIAILVVLTVSYLLLGGVFDRHLHDKSRGLTELLPSEGAGLLPVSSPNPSQVGEKEPAMVGKPTASALASRMRRNAYQFNFERDLIGDAVLTEDNEGIFMSKLIASPLALDAYYDEIAGDADAVALSRIYSKMAFDATEGGKKSVRLAGLVCGLQICMGEIVGGSDDEYRRWADSFTNSLGPMGNNYFTYSIVAHEQGETVLRFGFWVSRNDIGKKG